ncbi:hypothetical protein C0993_006786 [Termitomyces sp. T159_Od127]|nr:hypothetical protein C0993_006786 [Termitomyces sp. T159_Od127]
MDANSAMAKLKPLITQQDSLRRLLRSQGRDAQELLDLFQWLLDHPGLDEQLRKHITVSTQRISARTGLYPVCHELKNGIEHATQAGAGGQADIYKGSYQGRCVCIKVMRVFETMDKELVLKDRPCLVAPWLKNGNINKYLKENPQALRLPLAVGVARGLNYLHDKGIIHGDLKGSNVLVDDLGTARVADFGISSISDPEILTLTSHSGAASKGGTVRWQAPELIAMQDDFVIKNSKPSDAYAWACVCYEIFTGRIPLDHLPNDAAVMYHVAVKGVRPSPPPSSNPSWKSWGLTQEIWSIMKRCWQAEPSDRPTMNLVLNQLHELHTSALSSEPDTQFSPHRFRASMNKTLSKSKIVSTRVLDKLTMYQEPDAPTAFASRGEKHPQGQIDHDILPPSHLVGSVQRRVSNVRQIRSPPRQQYTALTLRPHFDNIKDVERPTMSLPLNSLQSSSVHLFNDVKGRYSDEGATLANMGHLITRLGAVFDDDTQFKKLIEGQGTKAQKLLDAFQTILDISGITSDFRHNVIIAAQELSKRSGLLPKCYILENIEMEIPAFSSEEAQPDYYKGHFSGRTVALKPLRFHSHMKDGLHMKVPYPLSQI